MILGIALNTKKIYSISIVLGTLGLVIASIGFIFVLQAIDRNLGNLPQPPDPDKLHRDEIPGILLEYAGLTLTAIGGALYVYVFIDRWRVATRRKSPGDVPRTEARSCRSCGNLDIEGATYCPECGKPLPRSISMKNGARTPADSRDSHKVAIRKIGKSV